MNTCALVSAANDDACPALHGDRSPRWVERPARVIGHRHRAMSHKTLPTTVDTFSFVISISWRQLLRNPKVSSPVRNVFHPTFTVCLLARLQPDREMCRADEPSPRVRKLRQALQRHPVFRPPALFGGNPWSRSAGAPRRPRRSTDRRPAGYRGRSKWPLWRGDVTLSSWGSGPGSEVWVGLSNLRIVENTVGTFAGTAGYAAAGYCGDFPCIYASKSRLPTHG